MKAQLHIGLSKLPSALIIFLAFPLVKTSNVTIIMSQRGLVLAAGSAVAGALFSVLRCSESTSSPKEVPTWLQLPPV